ncbi:hypothetical protein [Flocculibacter collagenilyticus]|uniref:hypothetical protein n=1 Tax=Flocculibacter collagenilyticus TaxID=2744479 RepID=UPI0018F3B1FC|nr:hypothetical protein [Flocculibacter collagenilyticus]
MLNLKKQRTNRRVKLVLMILSLPFALRLIEYFETLIDELTGHEIPFPIMIFFISAILTVAIWMSVFRIVNKLTPASCEREGCQGSADLIMTGRFKPDLFKCRTCNLETEAR